MSHTEIDAGQLTPRSAYEARALRARLATRNVLRPLTMKVPSSQRVARSCAGQSCLSQDPGWTPTYGTGDDSTIVDLLRTAGVLGTIVS